MKDIDWGKVIANAETIMSIHQEFYKDSLTARMNLSLSASGYLLYIASRYTNQPFLAIKSGVAFAMAGDFDEAESIIKNQIRLAYPLNDSLKVSLSISAPSLLSDFTETTNNPYQEFIKKFKQYLEKTKPLVRFNEIYELWEQCILDTLENYSSFENSLLRSARFTLCQHHQIRN